MILCPSKAYAPGQVHAGIYLLHMFRFLWFLRFWWFSLQQQNWKNNIAVQLPKPQSYQQHPGHARGLLELGSSFDGQAFFPTGIMIVKGPRSLMFHFTQNIQVRQQWRWAFNLWFCATHNMGGLATPYTNHQQHTNTMSTANHSVSKYRNQAQTTWRKTIL